MLFSLEQHGLLSSMYVFSRSRLIHKKSECKRHPFNTSIIPIQVVRAGWESLCLNLASCLRTLFYYLYFALSLLFDFITNLKVLSQWLMDQVPLGNKTPRPGYARQIWCPACKGLLENPLALTSGHVLLECMVVEGTQ